MQWQDEYLRPGGVIALNAVSGGPAIHAMGFGFVLWPVRLNALSMLALALLLNNRVLRRQPCAGDA